jgi:hypothetical protein
LEHVSTGHTTIGKYSISRVAAKYENGKEKGENGKNRKTIKRDEKGKIKIKRVK